MCNIGGKQLTYVVKTNGAFFNTFWLLNSLKNINLDKFTKMMIVFLIKHYGSQGIRMKKYVYDFEEGNAQMRDLLGGKGAGLAEMTRIGLPVPPGFTITTEACKDYFKNGNRFPDGLKEQILEHLRKLEEKTGKKFGGAENPLLVSVRSGAPVSMPGMMDTILNVGLNDETVLGLAKLTNNLRFAYDSYRRLIQMFSDIVEGIDKNLFEEVLERVKKEEGVATDAEISVDGLKKIIEQYKAIYKEKTGREFPQDPYEQLFKAIKRVFDSWNNERAKKYRQIKGIPEDMGTAVNVQMMVFGNFGWDSATGVAFTRNPATGEKEFYGEYLPNAQGEDVVAGIRTPKPISELKKDIPEAYEQLVKAAEMLERHYKDMQDIEFTIERGKLYLLQTRTGQRTPKAAVKIAVDMVKEGIITKEEAIMRIEPQQFEKLLHRQIDPKVKEGKKPIARGLPASPGAAVGKVIFNSYEAEELGKNGEKIILVRPETTPEDVGGMAAAQGILTSRGGMTSHAAVVARGMGKPAVVGAEAIKIDLSREMFEVNGVIVRKGDIITIDGGEGVVYLGEMPLVEPEMTGEIEELLVWADEFRRLGVRANAELPNDVRVAKEFGAEGIGLARTEHMFLGEDRVQIVRKMILAENEEERKEALEQLIPLQKGEFKEILEIMDGRKVIIRLLDPPLHEFLPNYEELLEKYYKLKYGGGSEEELREVENLINVLRRMRDANPMIGFRVCRLGIAIPEIYDAQARAAIEATAELIKEGKNPKLAIMIPGVSIANELKVLRERILKVKERVEKEYGIEVPVEIGTMIEMPRAALTSSEVAKYADFYSFGTNDLTQMTFGMSRDDAERSFIHIYVEKGIIPHNPFQTLDYRGVARLMKMAIEEGKSANPNLEVGICGEHGGDPRSIRICHYLGLDYVSASPFRIPIARLAAAQASIEERWYKEGKIKEIKLE